MSKFEEISRLVEITNGADRTRRNLFKMGAKLGAVAGVAAIASLTRIKPAAADPSFIPPGCKNPVPEVKNPNCVCFMKGTTIRTIDSKRKVEDLAAGDLLPTMFGGNRPIQWIARRSFKKSDASKSCTLGFGSQCSPYRSLRDAGARALH